MTKQDIPFLPIYFERYINQVPDMELPKALEVYGFELLDAEKNKLIQLGDLVYAPDKWTIADIMQHVIDTERIFAYRALRIGRNDQTPLPGFDENEYAVQEMPWDSMKDYTFMKKNTEYFMSLFL